MFPLDKRLLIRGSAGHRAAGLGIASDYRANYEPLYAPFDGTLFAFQEKQGGNWLRLTRADNGDRIEFAHLSKYVIKNGPVKEGTQIAVTGNTGETTTGPHAHIQIFRDGQRLEVEDYDWRSAVYRGTVLPLDGPIVLRACVIFNNQQFSNEHAVIAQLEDWFYHNSDRRLQLTVEVKHSNLSGWPTAIDPNAGQVIREEWFDQNVLPLAPGFDIVLLCIDPKDWTFTPWGGYYTLGMEYFPKYPCKMYLVAGGWDISQHYQQYSAFFDYGRHEISHALYSLGMASGFDLTHSRYYGLPPYEKNFEKIFADFNYQLLKTNLAKGRHMTNSKLVQVMKPDGSVELGFYDPDISQDSLISSALHRGYALPTKEVDTPNGKKVEVDFEKVKPDIKVTQA